MFAPDKLPREELAAYVDKNLDGEIVYVEFDKRGSPVRSSGSMQWQSGTHSAEIIRAFQEGASRAYEIWDDAGTYGFVYKKGKMWYARHAIDHYPQFDYLFEPGLPTRQQAVGALIYVDVHFITPIEDGKLMLAEIFAQRPRLLGLEDLLPMEADAQAQHAREQGTTPAGLVLDS